MRIALMQKQSFIDWPGKTVSVVFTKGCNFRCGFCHNPMLVLPHLLNQTPDISKHEVLEYLKSRADWTDGLVITGGEPTIHAGLPDFIRAVKQLGFKVKLDTNGTNPLMLRALIDKGLLDFVAMDVKTVFDVDNYNAVAGINTPLLIESIRKSLEVLRSGKVQFQLRTTLVPHVHTPEIANRLIKEFENDPYCLQYFRDGETLEKAFNKDCSLQA